MFSCCPGLLKVPGLSFICKFVGFKGQNLINVQAADSDIVRLLFTGMKTVTLLLLSCSNVIELQYNLYILSLCFFPILLFSSFNCNLLFSCCPGLLKS